MLFRSIRGKLVLATLAAVCLSLLANDALNYWVGTRATQATIAQNLEALEDAHANTIANWIATREDMIASLHDSAFDADPLPFFQQIARAGKFANVSVGWSDKRYIQTSSASLPSGYDPTVRPWYRQAVSAGKMVVTRPYADLLTGHLAVAFATPLLVNGTTRGVLSASVYMDSILNTVKAIHPTPHSFGALIDDDGIVLAYPDSRVTGKPVAIALPELDRIVGFGDRSPHTLTIDGVPKIARVQPIDGTRWRLITVLDQAEANAALRSQLTASALGLIFVAAIACFAMSATTFLLLKRLSVVRDAMARIASGSGDLTLRLPIRGRDEIAELSAAFNTFAETLCAVLKGVRSNSDAVRVAATQIAAGNLDLSSRTESAAASVGHISASMSQIVLLIKQSTDSAAQANEKSSRAKDVATQGGNAVLTAIESMNAIESASDSISDITSVIDSIAFQTNILALNAAVEAARAGESGRGFAVVASEVRELATRSAQAAKAIKTLIHDAAHSVESGAEQVHFVGNTVKAIADSITTVAVIVDEISQRSREHSSGIAAVEQAIATLDDVVQKNAALVEESAAAADSLRVQADELSAQVAQFRLE